MWMPVPDRRTSPRLKYNASVFSFFKTSGPATTGTGSEDLLYLLYCKIRRLCIRQGLQVDHESIEFKIFSLPVLKNLFVKVSAY